jgi:hypothetical protein
MSFLGSVQIQARKFLFAGRRRKPAQYVVNVLAYSKGSLQWCFVNSLCAWDGQCLQSTPLNVDSNNFECSSVTVYVGKRGRRRRATRAGMAKERLTLCDEQGLLVG